MKNVFALRVCRAARSNHFVLSQVRNLADFLLSSRACSARQAEYLTHYWHLRPRTYVHLCSYWIDTYVAVAGHVNRWPKLAVAILVKSFHIAHRPLKTRLFSTSSAQCLYQRPTPQWRIVVQIFFSMSVHEPLQPFSSFSVYIFIVKNTVCRLGTVNTDSGAPNYKAVCRHTHSQNPNVFSPHCFDCKTPRSFSPFPFLALPPNDQSLRPISLPPPWTQQPLLLQIIHIPILVHSVYSRSYWRLKLFLFWNSSQSPICLRPIHFLVHCRALQQFDAVHSAPVQSSNITTVQPVSYRYSFLLPLAVSCAE